MKSRLLCLFAAPVLAALPLLHADVSFAPIFTDHAVLQRGKPIPVWGRADPGEKVTVTYRTATAATVADPSGKWRVDLPAQAAGDPGELAVTGKTRAALQDVVVGEVWICSGQSNMAFLVEKVDNAATEIAASANPAIRHFMVAAAPSDTPLADVKGAWQTAAPETTGKFTAAGYFFAREVQPELGVPVGLINSSVGGTPVEAWMPAETFAAHPESLATAREVAATQVKRVANKSQPSVLYNGMIAPLEPYGAAGFLWYQGEANANARNPRSTTAYAENFGAMITSWRAKFGQGDLPFYFVQLPNFKTPKPDSGVWALLRDQQSRTLALPATGMAVLIDSGNPNNIHPTNKQVVGHRLALLALKNTYGRSVAASGPVPVQPGLAEGLAVISFDQELVLKPDSAGVFEVAGADGKFVPGVPRIEGQVLSVGNREVPEPRFVRYAWANNPTAVLFGKTGLPAAPFMIDLGKAPAALK